MLEIFVKEGCPYCRQQMEDFDRDGRFYEVYNVSSDPEALKKAKEQYKATKVPVVVEGGKVLSIGYQGAG